jgi:hypothetical protein
MAPFLKAGEGAGGRQLGGHPLDCSGVFVALERHSPPCRVCRLKFLIKSLLLALAMQVICSVKKPISRPGAA